jgi:uridylate kinase
MCSENNMPIVVFDINKQGNLLRLMKGESIGTYVYNG